uniref:DAZ-associated protein 2-like n=1 Tax=Odobenus rosmarus divergens TaxID=9708 RepID=UPI00063C832D|nr:PREDICTED: DAZ-associated protein 2-like [Odobenus rosmarus divergens]
MEVTGPYATKSFGDRLGQELKCMLSSLNVGAENLVGLTPSGLFEGAARLFWSLMLSRTRPITTVSRQGQYLTRPVSRVQPCGHPVYPQTSCLPQAPPVLTLRLAYTMAYGPLGSTIPVASYPLGPICPRGSTVLVEGGYFAGTRFRAGATGSTPPPPPGCLPRAAQPTVTQRAIVLGTQWKGNLFMGGLDGSTRIW